MLCQSCGKKLKHLESFCPHCGALVSSRPARYNTDDSAQTAREATPQSGPGRTGYSDKINDPDFKKYIKNANRWAVLFSIILAVPAVVGFFIAGQTGKSDMENPQALFIGLGIGAMFVLMALFQNRNRKHSRTWDGVVVDKTIKEKTRRKNRGNDDYDTQHFTEFAVVIRENKSHKTHALTAENDDTVYHYYHIGDLVRHHAGLNSYEKYDKSHDAIIFCAACASLCDINDDHCFRCKCPLLK